MSSISQFVRFVITQLFRLQDSTMGLFLFQIISKKNQSIIIIIYFQLYTIEDTM